MEQLALNNGIDSLLKAIKHKMKEVDLESIRSTYAELNQEVSALLDSVKNRMKDEDLARIRKAYLFARNAHKLQTRTSKEPYIIHPVAVARFVAEEMHLGADAIIAAFLHDVVEDSSYTCEYIQKQFGDEVEFLVRVLTNEKKEKYEMSKQFDSFRQIIDSVQYNIRAILIKLADRLHNMRTLSSLRPQKQLKIAAETEYFYAPLANRLGLYDIKTELQNLSFRYRNADEYALLEKLLKEEEVANGKRLELFTKKISKQLSDNGIPVKIEVHYKKPYSIWVKMKASNNNYNPIIENKRTIHIIFPDNESASEIDTCLKIYPILSKAFREKPNSIVNYINSPKENGYQSFHIKLLNEDEWEEVHIASERMVRNSKLGCIAERTDSNVESWIDKFKSVLGKIASDENEENYIENVVTHFYQEDMVVFSPKGQRIILPRHATALDYAYAIHSNIGIHAQYAHINGKLCSLITELCHGDRVYIGQNGYKTPNPEWLNHVLTAKAKRYILDGLSKIQQMPFERCPKCDPLPGDKLIAFKSKDGKTTIHESSCSEAISFAAFAGDTIVDDIDFKENNDILYPVILAIKAVDRFRLLIDLVKCITDKQNLSIAEIKTTVTDEIFEGTICFDVPSVCMLNVIIDDIKKIKETDEVKRISLKNNVVTLHG